MSSKMKDCHWRNCHLSFILSSYFKEFICSRHNFSDYQSYGRDTDE